MLNIFNLLTPNIDILKQESIKLLREESAISNSVLESDFLYGENEVIENIINILNR